MATVPAPNGLAALERDVLIAVAALVVHGARVGVDDGRVGDRLGVAVLLGHGCGCGRFDGIRLGWIFSSGVVGRGEFVVVAVVAVVVSRGVREW